MEETPGIELLIFMKIFIGKSIIEQMVIENVNLCHQIEKNVCLLLAETIVIIIIIIGYIHGTK